MHGESRALPFFGAMTIEVLQASQTSIHGDLYFDLLAKEAGDPASTPFTMRVARGSCTIPPTPGAMLKAHFLSGQVERLTPVG